MEINKSNQNQASNIYQTELEKETKSLAFSNLGLDTVMLRNKLYILLDQNL